MDPDEKAARRREKQEATEQDKLLKALEEVRAGQRELRVQMDDVLQMTKRLGRLEENVASLVRHQFRQQLGEPRAPFNLTSRRASLMTQATDAGITLTLIEHAGAVAETFIDIGCGKNGGSSGFLAAELGWTGLMVDANQSAIRALGPSFRPYGVTCVESFVSRENINELIDSNGLSGEQDLLSIDIDGNDYWVWEAVETCTPRLVIVEYNWRFGDTEAVTIPYKPDFDWKADARVKGYYGASLAALSSLGRTKGYRLVACDPGGTNAFFLREGLAPEIPAVTVPDGYRVPRNRKSGDPQSGDDFLATVRDRGLPLVEVD